MMLCQVGAKSDRSSEKQIFSLGLAKTILHAKLAKVSRAFPEQ
jgi:hypothetical protein